MDYNCIVSSILLMLNISTMIRNVDGLRSLVQIPVFKKINVNGGESGTFNKYIPIPGKDTVHPNAIYDTQLTAFPMPHLYSGDLHAHEDGEAFVMQDENEENNQEEEFSFEKEAAKTDAFIPYTYVIELSETYEGDSAPQASHNQHQLNSANPIGNHLVQLYQPRLKSEEVLKKVEVYVEKGFDRGAYDHKGYEDHDSKWDNYKETVKGKYRGGSSSKTREHENYHQDMIPYNSEPHNALDRSESSPKSVLASKRKTGSKRYGNKENTIGRTVSIPTIYSSRRKERRRNNRPYKGRKRIYSSNKERRRRPDIYKSQSQKIGSELAEDTGFMSSRAKSISPSISVFGDTGSSPSSFQGNFENSLDQLFALPTSSSYYNNFKSRHTIPAFKSQNKLLGKERPWTDSQTFRSKPQRKTRHRNSLKRRPKKKKRGFLNYPTSNKIQIPPSFGQTKSEINEDVQKLATNLGQPVDLLRKEPCLSTSALTANFKFGKFKPDLGPPKWFEKDQHVLEPLKGQVDILREQVYAPALREALCL